MNFSFVYPNALWLLLLIPLTVGIALLGPRRPTVARFWWGLALRSLLLALIVLALAGIQLRRPIDQLTTVFVLDVSDSISAEAQQRGETIIRQAVDAMPEGDQAAIVVYGKDALVERLATKEQALADLTSAPVTSQTNIASALQLATALFPSDGAKRLVLLSDGQENVGQALDQAELAAANQIEISFVPLGTNSADNEVLVEALNAPSNLRAGQAFDLTAIVHSTSATNATLRVFGDDTLLFSDTVSLQAGRNRFQVPVDALNGGFYRFRAQIVPESDTRLQNNEASSFTVVRGAPQILLVEGKAGEADQFALALASTDLNVVTVAPADLPNNLDALAAFESVALINASATSLPSGAMEMLQVYVRDLGKGLLMIGGEDSFGAGGYLRTPIEEALPVDMDIRNSEQTPNIALALVVDKSGSMGNCHCNDPNNPAEQQARAQSGQPKVDIAKEAVMQAAEALGPQDQLGVVAFDSAARVAVNMAQLGAFDALERNIAGIQASGQTNLQAGVETALMSLETANARRKHMILLTDGWGQEGRLNALVDEMSDAGITLSVVAAGSGSSPELAALAEQSGGRYYAANDILRVPDFFLKETVTAVGRYLVEEPFYPLLMGSSPILNGVDLANLPTLWGYNGSTAKPLARTVLATPKGDPLLATWQYGLGRAAVWTSDVTARWAVDWVDWNGYAQFANQLVDWTLAPPQIEGFSAQATAENGQALITVDATEEVNANFDIVATLIGPELEKIEVPLEAVGVGKYAARTAADEAGVYLVQLQVTQNDQPVGGQTLGLAVPYSPEYGVLDTNRGLLSQLAERTGGSELLDPLAAFLHNLPLADQVREIWQWLLLATALLFPLDIALRRVLFRNISPQQVAGQVRDSRTITWIRERVPQRSTKPTPSAADPNVDVQVEKPSEPIPADPQSEGEAGDDTISRLRQAKKRARR